VISKIAFIILLCAFTRNLKADIVSGLMAHWKLDELNSGNVIDASSNNITGTQTSTRLSDGKIMIGRYFNGAASVSFGAGTVLRQTSFTLTAWVNCPMSGSGDQNVVVVMKDGFPFYGLVLLVNTSSKKIGFYQESVGRVYSTALVPANTWTLIALRAYCDPNSGVASGFVESSINAGAWERLATYNTTNQFSQFEQITPRLCYWNATAEYYTGKVDDVRIYNRFVDINEVYTMSALRLGDAFFQHQ